MFILRAPALTFFLVLLAAPGHQAPVPRRLLHRREHCRRQDAGHRRGEVSGLVRLTLVALINP